MPYKIDVCGIYKIVNTVTEQCYVGQSRQVKKRLSEHFSRLRKNKHTNAHLQDAFNKYGESAFYGALEVECTDPKELDALEKAFVSGDAWFEENTVCDISYPADAPMRGKKHPESVREKIRIGRRASTFDFRSTTYRATLSAAQMARFHSDPKFIAKLKFILNNPTMSYAERARMLGADTSAVRRLALKYNHLKGAL
jgi:group I intron endonuclease